MTDGHALKELVGTKARERVVSIDGIVLGAFVRETLGRTVGTIDPIILGELEGNVVGE